MASATVTSKPWGWSVTGGTDATTVTTNNVRICGVVCTATASADTCLIADQSGTTIIKLVAPVTLANNEELEMRTKGIVVTLSATGSVLNILA